MDANGSLVVSQVTASAVAVGVIEIAKKLPWIPIGPNTDVKVMRFVGALAALLTAMGLHATYATTGGVLTIYGLTTTNMLWGAAHWVRSFIFQEGSYRFYKISKYLPMVYKAIDELQKAKPAGG